METELYKDRSVSGCIKAGAALLLTHFSTLICRLWLPGLLYALVSGGLYLLFTTILLGEGAAEGIRLAESLLFLGGEMAIVALFGYVFAGVMGLLQENGVKANLMKAMKISFLLGALLFAIGQIVVLAIGGFGLAPMGVTIAGASSSVWMWALLIIATGGLLLLVPFHYVAIKYFFCREAKLWKHLLPFYVTGLKHWGFLFGISFFTTFIAVVVGALLFLPVSILFLAQLQSAVGQSMGDASGLPTYFPLLQFASVALCTLLFLLISVWALFVSYYAFGAIEARGAKS